MSELRRLSLREWTPWSGELTLDEARQLALRAKDFLSVDLNSRGAIVLQPRSIVGRLRVENLDLYVAPKAPIQCVLAMLSEALELVDFTSMADVSDSDTLDELIVLAFLNEVSALLGQGLSRNYVATREQVAVARGRIDPRASTELFLRGRLGLYCEFEEFTIDTPENRVLASTLRALLSSPVVSARRRARAKTLEADFLGVSEVHVDLVGVGKLGKDVRTRHYRRGLALAELVLRSLGFHERHGEWRSTGFLVDMNRLFETVVSRRLCSSLRSRGLLVETQVHETLDVYGTVDIRPDLVVRHPKGRCVVVDAKYKINAESAHADLYQMVAYCRAIGASDAVLVDAAPGTERTLLVRDNVTAIRTLHVNLQTRETLSASIEAIAHRLAELTTPTVDAAAVAMAIR